MARCTVKFGHSNIGPFAMLLNSRGQSINVMNYPRDYRLTNKERVRARRVLMRGCDELSRTHARQMRAR